MGLVGVLALTIALSAALMSALLARHELAYEDWIPGHQSIYLAASGLAAADRPTFYLPQSPGFLAALMRGRYPEIERIARVTLADVQLQHGSFAARERIYWADPDFFRIFAFRSLHGSLESSLQRPDGIVITQSIARKFFPQSNPVGETLTVDGAHVMRVEAVIDDLPANSTMLESGIFASGIPAFSGLSECDQHDEEDAHEGALHLCGLTFFKLRPKTNINLIRRGDADLVHLFPGIPGLIKPTVPILQLDQVHLFEGFNPGARNRLQENLGVGLLVLLAGCLVYVNLATARASRRAVEVGVRKACGASHVSLILQFLSESLLVTLLSGLLAASLTELLLPQVNAWLNLHLRFEYWREPLILAWFAVALLVVGLLAGVYPAFLLSRFQPTEVLRGVPRSIGGVSGRQILVVAQCAILIGLVAASITIFKQRHFATHDAIKLRTDAVLVIRSRCTEGFVDGLRKLHGVGAVICSASSLLNQANFEHAQRKNGTPLTVNIIETDFAAFRMYGVPPIAGQGLASTDPQQVHRVVINEAARRALHLTSAAAAIGSPLELKDSDGNWLGTAPTDTGATDSAATIIVGVVPDFALDAAMNPVRPTIYWPYQHSETGQVTDDTSPDGVPLYQFVHVKLTGTEIPETLQQIDALWRTSAKQVGHAPSTIKRFFVREEIESRYQAVLQQGEIFAAFSALAIVLAGLGLLGLAAAAAERRTKEIGIRKALGASRRDIMLMLLTQFSSPVLWASLIAWPASGWLINRWLQGFALHTDLSVLTFFVASLLALTLSLLTVFTHAWRVANAKPVVALRYE
jgi:putative ABC transport system permease protein